LIQKALKRNHLSLFRACFVVDGVDQVHGQLKVLGRRWTCERNLVTTEATEVPLECLTLANSLDEDNIEDGESDTRIVNVALVPFSLESILNLIACLANSKAEMVGPVPWFVRFPYEVHSLEIVGR
jgi:hypothetical protein